MRLISKNHCGDISKSSSSAAIGQGLNNIAILISFSVLWVSDPAMIRIRLR